MLRKIVVPFQTFLNLPDLPVLILPRSGGGGWLGGQLRLYSLAQPSYARAFAELGNKKAEC